MNLDAFNARWLGNDGGERANKDPKAMNCGGEFGFEGTVLRFNGRLFAAPQALALTRG